MVKLIVANWKLNPQTEDEATKLAEVSDKENVVIAAPFIFLKTLKNILKAAKLGAENSSIEEDGAFTGEVSAKMLKNLGVSYVIVGHSERRKNFNETDEIVNKKLEKIISNGLNPILCVGEDISVRQKGINAVQEFIKNQINASLKGFQCYNLDMGDNELLIAYEPIWAIGSGVSDKPEDSAEIIKFIKDYLFSSFHLPEVKVLYGGSVNGENAADFLRKQEIDGVLVGSASLHPEEFKKILNVSRS